MGLAILHTADWHLGHSKTRTKEIALAIRKYLFPKIKEVKIVTLVGDITDTTISLSSSSSYILTALFIDLFYLLDRYNVVMRIVRGTIMHDRDQLQFVDKLLKRLPINPDVKVINKPSVEYIESLSSSFLYLPDDLPFQNKAALFRHVKQLLISTGGEVDYVLCHGMFDFTCKGFFIPDAYSVKDFSFCKQLILAGHIHTPQNRNKVLYSGSFDRLSHNEEHKKGFYIVGDKVEFIQNKDAILYKSITYPTSTIDKLYEVHSHFIDKTFKDVPYGYVRVFLDDVQLKQALRSYHNKCYPKILLTFKNTKERKASDDLTLLENREEMDLEPPTSANLPRLLTNYLSTYKKKTIPIERIKEVLDNYD